jgi:F-type H+-transporting ATPase subunit a
MEITPDRIIVAEVFGFELNATIVWTWVVMAVLVAVSLIATHNVRDRLVPSRWQMLLETIIEETRRQIREVSQSDASTYLPFIGTLFLFIATANLFAIVPGYAPPTGSLSTTTALAIAVFVAVPLYGIADRGMGGYLKNYIQPTPFMLPFNIIGEISRTLALAIRLYGNVMSGAVIAGILISVAPFFFPIVMHLLGLLTGLIQAYIFAILAMVYIASATGERTAGGQEGGGGDIPEKSEARGTT